MEYSPEQRKNIATKAVADMYQRLTLLTGRLTKIPRPRKDTLLAEEQFEESIRKFVAGEYDPAKDIRPSVAMATYETLRSEEIIDAKRGRSCCDICGKDCDIAIIDVCGERTCSHCFVGQMSDDG